MRNRGLLTMVVLTCPALALAACGSSTNDPTTKLAATAGAGSAGTALELSQCMRSHGVPNFPDPASDGSIDLTPGSGLNPQAPAFQAAQQACKRFSPFKGGPPTMSESQRRAAVRFAECMRANGQSGFPDPTEKPPPGTTRVLALRGMVFAFGPGGIDPTSPAFRQAAKKCGVTPP